MRSINFIIVMKLSLSNIIQSMNGSIQFTRRYTSPLLYKLSNYLQTLKLKQTDKNFYFPTVPSSLFLRTIDKFEPFHPFTSASYRILGYGTFHQERIFSTLQRFVGTVTSFNLFKGGIEVGSYLLEQCDSMHITGSDKTYDAIVWGI